MPRGAATLLWFAVGAHALLLAPVPIAPRAGLRSARRAPARVAPTAIFDSFFPNAEADAKLDQFVSSSRAVLFTDGSAKCASVVDQLKRAKVGNWKEIRLDAETDASALVGALKRRVGTSPPTLIVGGTVFDQKRIEYLIKQDMMLPVFRAAGTSGEVRLPFQDLRFYLSKTIR